MHTFLQRIQSEIKGTLSGFRAIALFNVGWDKLASSAGPPSGNVEKSWWAGAAKRHWSHPTRFADSTRRWPWSGLDRMRFRGTLRWLASLRGLRSYLGTMQVLLMNFKDWAMERTEQIAEATERRAEAAGRPVVYLESSREWKEARALDIARADGVTAVLIAVLKCVEPCQTFTVGGNRAAKKLELRPQSGKCSHLYFSVLDPQFGLMHLRLQMWVSFSIHVCLNGRDWLANPLTQAAIGFDQRDNCFVDVDDLARAQALLSQQLRTH